MIDHVGRGLGTDPDHHRQTADQRAQDREALRREAGRTGARGLPQGDGESGDQRQRQSLSSLDREAGRTMRDLAEQWECDASNATWIVDRLERFGLAERRALPADRRVRQVVLTARGERLRAELLAEFHTPPDELLRLSRRDLEALARALEKL